YPPRFERAEAGMEVWRFGPAWAINLAGSAFEKAAFGHIGGRPGPPDATLARAAIELCKALVAEDLAPTLHDISDGGLALALAEVCIEAGIGAEIEYAEWRQLFAEDPHRLIAAIRPEDGERVAALAAEAGIEAARIGTFGGSDITFVAGAVCSSVPVAKAADTYRQAIAGRMR
ncbi:MAG: AIR synthase-related protein, partial [Acidimicrobiia bacterium]|nr:AIR synthase-related protein [Acidimicrobiia bacterium]